MSEGEDGTPPQLGLDSFGVSNQPRAEKVKRLTLGKRKVGWIARHIPSGSLVYASRREVDEHRYQGSDPYYAYEHDDPGYGLSLSLFSPLHDRDIGAVYILEDTGRVLHFSFMQFVNGTAINTKREAEGRGYEKDVQKVVPITEAKDSWEDATSSFWAKQQAFR